MDLVSDYVKSVTILSVIGATALISILSSWLIVPNNRYSWHFPCLKLCTDFLCMTWRPPSVGYTYILRLMFRNILPDSMWFTPEFHNHFWSHNALFSFKYYNGKTLATSQNKRLYWIKDSSVNVLIIDITCKISYKNTTKYNSTFIKLRWK